MARFTVFNITSHAVTAIDLDAVAAITQHTTQSTKVTLIGGTEITVARAFTDFGIDGDGRLVIDQG